MSEQKKVEQHQIIKLPTDVKLLSAAIFLMGCAVTVLLSYTWGIREDYSFGYLTPVFVLYILWIRKDKILSFFSERGKTEVKYGTFGLILDAFFWAMFICGIATYTAFAFLYFLTQNRGVPSFTMTFAFSFTFFASAYIASVRRSDGCRASTADRLKFLMLFTFPSFIWLVAAPMFDIFENLISLKLLTVVANIDYTVMDSLGYVVRLRKNVLEFPNGSVGVAEACSGIRSLTACIFAGSFLSAAMLDKFWKKIALVVSSMILAFFFNLCRSLFLALWAYENGADSISGTVHDTAGYIILGCTVVGLLLLVQLFNISPVPKEFREENR